MVKAIAILITILTIAGNGMAQQILALRGTVRDSTGSPLTNATVRLTAAKDTLTTLTGEDGAFHFRIAGPKIPAFRLTVTMKGYKPYAGHYLPEEPDHPFLIPAVTLLPDYHTLEPVTVAHIKPFTIREDTIDYHAAAFPVREGAELEALLKRLPGIEVGQAGEVIVQGKKITKVMVNGKLFFGGDPLTATRNLPAGIIDKVEVIDDYGDKARLTGIRTGEPAKVLNIILKQDHLNGAFGHAQAGIGNHDMLATQVFANTFRDERQLSLNGGFRNDNPAGRSPAGNASLSFSNRWNSRWTTEANLQSVINHTSSTSGMTRDDYYADGKLHQEQNNRNSGDNRNASLGTNIVYSPDPTTVLRMQPTLAIQQGTQYQSSGFLTAQQDSGFNKTTTGFSNTKTRNNTLTAGSVLYYEHTFPSSRRRFSALANVQYSDARLATDNLVSSLITADSVHSHSFLHYLVANPTRSLTMSADINYFSPLGKNGFLEFGYSGQTASNTNDKETRQLDSAQTIPQRIDSLSSGYFFRSSTQRLHTGYIARFGKLSMNLGLDGQAGALRGTADAKGNNAAYHYFNWLPAIQGTWSFARTRTLALTYNGTSAPPSLQQLQPVPDLSNPQYPVLGNPGLKPAYAQSVDLHYEHSSFKPTQYYGFGIGLGYNTIRDNVISHIIHARDTGAVIQTTTFLNTNGFHTLRLDYHAYLPAFFHKRVRITLGGDFSSAHTVSMTDSILYGVTSLNASENLHIQCIIPDLLETDLSGVYTLSHSTYSAPGTSPFSSASAGWSLNNKHYFGPHWILAYGFSQSFTDNGNHRLQPNPGLMTASIQDQFLRHNRATISLTGFDLLNSATGISQTVTPTSILKTHTDFIGRYFILSFIFKWGKFN